MKHYSGLVLLGLAAFFPISCGEESQPETPLDEVPEEIQITFGVVPKSTGGEFWETVEAGAREAAAELGVSIRWEGTVTETELAEQNKIVENMINLGVQGIALAPLNRAAQRKLVQTAVDAGIPVVIFDSAVDGGAHSSFVATDNRQGGANGATKLVELLGGKGRVMMMHYVQGTGSTDARADGFAETCKAGGLELVAHPYPDSGTIEGSKSVAANTLEGFVQDGKLELEGIFACNLTATLGVDSALEDLRKSGVEVDLAFVGFDTSKKLIEGVQEGRIDALVAQNPFRMGELAVKTLHEVCSDGEYAKVIDTGVALVTADALKNDPAIRALVGLK